MSILPICPYCHKPYYDDGSYTSPPELCMGHVVSHTEGDRALQLSNAKELVAIEQPNYSLVLERIAIALEDIANRLGYLRSIAK